MGAKCKLGVLIMVWLCSASWGTFMANTWTKCLFYLSFEKLEPHFFKIKNHFPHHKSFPEKHELLQYSPRPSQTSSPSHCCHLERHKTYRCSIRCTRYLAYLFGDWDEFASFEKEKLRDRRFSEVVLPILLSFKSLLATKGARNPLLDKLYVVQLCWYLD